MAAKKKDCGEIRNWKIVPVSDNRVVILGESFGHPRNDYFLDGGPIQTSKVVSLKWKSDGTVACETLNSRYTLK